MFLKDRENLKALIYYALFIALFYSPVLFTGKSLMPSLYQSGGLTSLGGFGAQGRVPANTFNVDIATPAYYESPINKLVGDQVRSGVAPLWNPYQAAGTPLAAQYSTRALFPLQILEDISPVLAWDFFMLLRLLIASIFTFLFLRSLSLLFVPAFLGGLFYMFSGAFVWFINLEQMVNGAMMLPVFFFAVARLSRRGRFGDVALVGVVIALTIMAGSPALALYIFIAGGAYYLLTLFFNSSSLREGRAFFRAIFDISLASLMGLALSAPLLIPFFELLSNAYAGSGAGGDIAPLSLLATIFTPTASELAQDPSMLHGLCPLVSSADGNFFRYLPVSGIWERLGGYIGSLPVLLAVAGLIVSSRLSRAPWRAPLYFFLALAVVVILNISGGWLSFLTFTGQIGSGNPAGPLWVFALSCAGAIGLQMILPDKCLGDGAGYADAASGGGGGAVMAPHPLLRKIELYLRARPHIPVILSVLVVAAFYTYAVLIDTVMLLLRSKEIFNARVEPFVWPSIGGGVAVFFIVLILFLFIGISVTRSLKGRGYAALVFLAALELWWAVPRGYGPDALDP